MLDPTVLEEALHALGAVLEARGHALEIVTVGGGSLLLLDLATRSTRDLDIVALVQDGQYMAAKPLPEALVEAARDVGGTLGLGEDWLNAGPTDLLAQGLPTGFAERTERRTHGSLVLHIASRFDQIHLKLYDSVDQGPRSKHVADLRLLSPTRDELLAAAHWACQHDPSEPFRDELIKMLRSFGVDGVDDQV
jgi:hypothetical protein